VVFEPVQCVMLLCSSQKMRARQMTLVWCSLCWLLWGELGGSRPSDL